MRRRQHPSARGGLKGLFPPTTMLSATCQGCSSFVIASPPTIREMTLYLLVGNGGKSERTNGCPSKEGSDALFFPSAHSLHPEK
jgi:hypothetical protein